MKASTGESDKARHSNPLYVLALFFSRPSTLPREARGGVPPLCLRGGCFILEMYESIGKLQTASRSRLPRDPRRCEFAGAGIQIPRRRAAVSRARQGLAHMGRRWQ